jgi:hypothetical protein
MNGSDGDAIIRSFLVPMIHSFASYVGRFIQFDGAFIFVSVVVLSSRSIRPHKGHKTDAKSCWFCPPSVLVVVGPGRAVRWR